MVAVPVRNSWIAALALLLGACGTLGRGDEYSVDCKALQSSCHHGRFGLLWKTINAAGEVEADTVSGSYEWRSGRSGPSQAPEVAYLEVRSKLGPTLGSARRIGSFYEVRAADGRVYLAQNWQALFDLMFPVALPAEALVQWMENPNANNLPPLPPNWAWDNADGRYRILFVENATSGRIDLIPQGELER
ncbi:MAG TPA: hypothetical protein VFV39_04020 [Limnobacter sp.]|nr:hypothetical protein [Limnobacter sp.]